ncbi:PIN domain-like protein, partial [Mycena vitilis]
MTTSDLWPVSELHSPCTIARRVQVIASAAVPTSLLDIATVEGFQANNRGLRTLVIGDNISVRISAVAHALDPFDPPGPTGQRPVLQTLFHQLSQFLLAPVTMVFIFDGPGCPGYSAMGLEEVLKTMITAFGFHYYEAPGAAEAELAQLNKAGEIDAILSGDSDAFLYGAQCVIRPSGPSVEDVALIYTVECIENSEPALTRDGLLLFALLLSIDTDGDMKDAGMYGVVSQRFGVDLVEVLATCGGGSVLNRRLDLWRIHLRRELGTASCKSLNEAHSRLAGRIPDTFPNLRVAESYLNPLTSRSPGFTGPLPEVERWQPRDPCIPDVAAFCALRLGWTGHDLLKRLNSALWPGILFRLISSVSEQAMLRIYL